MRRTLALIGLLAAATAAHAQSFTSGFEEGDPPRGWTLGDGGLSNLSTAQRHTGQRSLRIADPDSQAGSSVRSDRIKVAPGQICLVSAWTFLEQGDPSGLGVYLDFTDAQGKRLEEASEASSHRPAMRQGRWSPITFTVAAPEKAAEAAVWLHTFSTAVVTCFVDDVEVKVASREALGPAVDWSGGRLDSETRKTWPYSVRWEHGASSALSRRFAQPEDWSRFGGLRFSMYAPAATGATFMVIVPSENPAAEGSDYYAARITVDWSGWKELTLPFREMGVAREPLGWEHIEGVTFTAAGWGQTLNPETVLVLDGFELVPVAQLAAGLSDEAFFASLNLDLPGLARVRQAVGVGDMAAARVALAAHLRERTAPRWVFDWRTRPLRGARVPGPEEDQAPDQWDYYSVFLTVDWQGWKHLALAKDDFSPKAFVEGQGWKGKRPIGWHWIQYLGINAKGWGLTPNPGTTLYFDDVTLVGKGKPHVISDFEAETVNWTGLERSTEQQHGGKASGKWANHDLNPNLKCTDLPHDWTDYDTLDFWVYSVQATGERVVLLLDSDVPGDIAAAEKVLRHEFDFSKGPGETGTITFGKEIDWTANPTEGEARTHLWNEALNRHFHFRTLAQAYWNSGREKYAAEIAAEVLDWTARMPRPMLSSGNDMGHYAWQTLTTSIRLADTWPEALYRCLDSPSFTPEVLTALMKSVGEQCRHLVKWPTGGNWLTSESNGLFTAGMLFPEFREARDWRRIAIERLYRQLDDEVYPDGMEYELAAGYNNWVVSEFAHLVELADLNGLRAELPADYLAKTEKMYSYLLLASMPNGALPGLNDSGNSDVRSLLQTGFRLFPQREDFGYVATGRAAGAPPRTLSCSLPWSGHYVMRSGWDANATYLLLDAGPYGYGHQHEDKLHFVLWANGRQLLLDPGNYSYDRSRWRRYVLATYGHNTVLVDGLNQNRSGKRETYFWPRPWRGAAPAGNTARWASAPAYDFASGVYSDGYGPKAEVDVVHVRRILYLKGGGYFLVLDALTPRDDREHRYEALFHLDTGDARADESGAVTTLNEGGSNLIITPAGKLAVEIVKGKTEEPVQGWSSGPWRAIPTAIYRQTGKGAVRLAFVLEPVATGAARRVKSVAVLPGPDDGLAVELTLADGRRQVVIARDAPGPAREVAGIASSRGITVVMRSADGAVADQFAFDPAAP